MSFEVNFSILILLFRSWFVLVYLMGEKIHNPIKMSFSLERCGAFVYIPVCSLKCIKCLIHAIDYFVHSDSPHPLICVTRSTINSYSNDFLRFRYKQIVQMGCKTMMTAELILDYLNGVFNSRVIISKEICFGWCMVYDALREQHLPAATILDQIDQFSITHSITQMNYNELKEQTTELWTIDNFGSSSKRESFSHIY